MRLLRGLIEALYGGCYWLAFMLGGHFYRRGLLHHRGQRVKIAPTVFFKYPENISIGNDSFLNHNCCIWAAPNSTVSIGNDVLLGPNVCISASNHGFEMNEIIRLQPGNDESIIIGNDVWLGANVVVTAGVEIGDGCVVGAGAVVTRNLPPYTICGGIPAKVLRSRDSGGS